MFERIVAAVDLDPERSTKVVDAAQEIARAFNSNVLVAHVRELERPPAMLATTARPGATPPAMHVEGADEARQLVDEGVRRLQAAGIVAQGQIGEGAGSTARELLDIAQQHEANLIIVGDRQSRVTDLLLGGVANRIAHLAPCPVLVVR